MQTPILFIIYIIMIMNFITESILLDDLSCLSINCYEKAKEERYFSFEKTPLNIHNVRIVQNKNDVLHLLFFSQNIPLRKLEQEL